MRSYTVFPDLGEKIRKTWLLEKFPELNNKPFPGYFSNDDLYGELGENFLNLPDYVRTVISKTISNPHNWIIEEKVDKGGDLFWNIQKIIPTEQTDIAIGSWFLLPVDEEFDSLELQKFSEYGFSSIIEMILSLSAYRYREVSEMKREEYSWVNSQGIKNIFTACIHGDPKFYQYKEVVEWDVYSPYQILVWFSPRQLVGIMSQVYHSHELWFFSTFFRYAMELWVLDEIMWKDGKNFYQWEKELPSALWNYADAGHWDNYMDNSEFLFRTSIPIWWNSEIKNVHTHTFAPWFRNEDGSTYYEFRIWNNKELHIYNAHTKSVDIVFYPEDCKNLLQWILHQCAHGHGRTSKSQIVNLVKFYHSEDYQKRKGELSL